MPEVNIEARLNNTGEVNQPPEFESVFDDVIGSNSDAEKPGEDIHRQESRRVPVDSPVKGETHRMFRMKGYNVKGDLRPAYLDALADLYSIICTLVQNPA